MLFIRNKYCKAESLYILDFTSKLLWRACIIRIVIDASRELVPSPGPNSWKSCLQLEVQTDRRKCVLEKNNDGHKRGGKNIMSCTHESGIQTKMHFRKRIHQFQNLLLIYPHELYFYQFCAWISLVPMMQASRQESRDNYLTFTYMCTAEKQYVFFWGLDHKIPTPQWMWNYSLFGAQATKLNHPNNGVIWIWILDIKQQALHI